MLGHIPPIVATHSDDCYALMLPMVPDADAAGMKTVFGGSVKPETNRSAGL